MLMEQEYREIKQQQLRNRKIFAKFGLDQEIADKCFDIRKLGLGDELHRILKEMMAEKSTSLS